MKRKLLLTCGLLLIIFCLTGCGAQVTSDLKFKADGSGSRNVEAVISADDAKNIEGGFEELDLFLEEAAPEGVNLSRTMLENGDAKYQFSFYFENITEYNEKIALITGNKHEATWYSNESVFLSDIHFQEKQCTKDLVEWALVAFKNSKYAKVSSYFSLYEVGENRVYYEEELLYTGKKNPSFEKKIAPVLKKASMYTTYRYENEVNKKLVLEFESGGLERMNLELAKQALNVYSNEYTIDLGNATITFDLNRQAMTQFFTKVDKQFKAEDLMFAYKNNPFQREYQIQEKYNLRDFFLQFNLEYPYIYDYIHVPEEITYQDIYHLNQIPDVEPVENFDYQGAFRYDSDYKMGFHADKKVAVKNLRLSYNLDERLEGNREVTISFLKNKCELSKKELIKLYPEVDETVSVIDNEDVISITFVTKLEVGTRQEDAYTTLKLDKVKQTNLKDVYYKLSDIIDVNRYLPQIEGYEYDLTNLRLDYQINTEQKSNIYHATILKQEYVMKKEKNEEVALLGDYLSQGNYILQGQVAVNDPIQVELKFQKIDPFYYFWLILIGFLIILSILIGVIYFRKKERNQEIEGEQEVGVNWE